MQGLNKLKELYPWPAECPDVKKNLTGWFCGQNMRMLEAAIKESHAQVIVELGSWLGLSTHFLCEQAVKTGGVVIAIDHWKGSSEHQVVPEWSALLPTLYETFLTNLWKFRDICIPVKETTVDGILLLKSLGISPDVFYVDASHETDFVVTDLCYIIENFPEARIVGDDFSWDSVQAAVENVCEMYGRHFNEDTTCYEILLP